MAHTNTSADEQQWIAQLKRGEEEAYRDVYRTYKTEFIQWAGHKYPDLKQEYLTEIFQDAVVALLDNAIRGKLDDLSVALKTYLFAIGKYKIYERFRQKDKTDNDPELMEKVKAHQTDTTLEMARKEEVEQVRQILRQTEEPCRSILDLYYLREYSMEAVAERLQYKNTDVVKSQKLRCLKALRKRLGYGNK